MSDTKQIETNREIATTADGIDITRGYTGPLMVSSDSLLNARGGGDLSLYEQIYSDPDVKGALNQRELAVTQCEWIVEPGGKRKIDIAAADDLRKQLKRLNWDNITTKMLAGVFYGYAVAEIIYKPEGDRVVIDRIKVRNRRRFRFGKMGDLRLMTLNSMLEGIPAAAPYFWHFATGADHDDEPYGLGLAHWLYWPVLFKRNGIKFWLIFLEKFGMPTGVGKYDPTASDTERARLLQATRAITVDSGVIIPKGMELDLLEAARSGTADYKTLHDTMNATIAKVILGQTASSQGTPGKLGNEDLQADVRADIVKADADLICESFNTGPARWLTERNFPGAAVPRVYRVTEAPEDLKSRADRDTAIFGMGFKPTLAYVQDTYGGEWEEKPAPQPAVVDALSPEATPPASFAEDSATADPAARMAAQLEPALQPMIEGWIEQIRVALQRATSIEEARAALDRMAEQLDLEEYAAVMREASVAAELAGRYQVQQSTSGSE
ncbi:DUF935 domain-containing protein [Lysobacter sp. CA199]|uniref:DUF935 domain-containing protein n=1 Tax=Lysobacter sp. CA199 TaxID=3455608 RepID=UPI003F8D030C